MDESIPPHMVGVRGTCRCSCALASWVPLAHALHHLEPLLLPYAPDGLATDPPVFTLQQGVQLPRAQPWIPLRQDLDTSHQLARFRRAGLPAFGTTMQCHHATSTSRTDTVRLFQIHRCAALDSQAYQFFPSTSFSILLSSGSSP